jgi:hypothetical protein
MAHQRFAWKYQFLGIILSLSSSPATPTRVQIATKSKSNFSDIPYDLAHAEFHEQRSMKTMASCITSRQLQCCRRQRSLLRKRIMTFSNFSLMFHCMPRTVSIHRIFNSCSAMLPFLRNMFPCAPASRLKGYGVATLAQNKIFPAKQELLLSQIT